MSQPRDAVTGTATSTAAEQAHIIDRHAQYLIETAARAPSVHNSQPWRFRVGPQAIELWCDPRRKVQGDPIGREMLVSCGAALYGLRLAVRSLGCQPVVDLLPDRSQLRLMARVSAGAAAPINGLEREMLAAVPHRHTHRGPFTPGPLPAGLLAGLQNDALAEGATLVFVEDALSYARLAQIAAAAARRGDLDPRARAEIRRWTRTAASTARDGVPAVALTARVPAQANRGRLPQRDFDLGRSIARLPGGGAPPVATAVLLTSGDRRADWLRAGQALQRVLLHAATKWVFASLHTQPLENAVTRALIRDQLALPGSPQMVLQLGLAHSAASTARRPPGELTNLRTGAPNGKGPWPRLSRAVRPYRLAGARALTELVKPQRTPSAEDLPGAVVFRAGALDQLLGAIRRRGFRLVGPVIKDGAICYDDITSAADLPAGWTDEQDAGTYRLRQRDDGALFGYNVGPHSWKKYLFPPHARLLPLEQPPAEPFAFIGVRACELNAIAIQDRVFLGGQHKDPHYEARRDRAFIVAVNCGQAGGTCFCASMDAGPRATSGYDIALTELLGAGAERAKSGEDGKDHRFLAEAGTARGAEVLAEVQVLPAGDPDIGAARAVTEHAAASMGRAMPELDLRTLLTDNYDHPRWDDVAARCLSCANCTMVCPTCFCFSVEDVSSLSGGDPAGRPGPERPDGPERHRSWDSCFTMDHSYLHGGPVRVSTRSRYRQWLTHKLATWADQFGTPGCVGCGRCITWCPAGIDITEEVAAIAADS